MIAGDGPGFIKIKKKIDEYNLQDRIILPGYLTDIRPLLLDSSVYLLSSRWEGFPMCVTEAFEIGLPIICYDIPAVIPLTRNGEGFVIEKFRVENFATAMLKLSEDFETRMVMSFKAQKMADSISIENIGLKWLKLIEGKMC